MSTTNMNRWAKIHNIPLRPRGGASHRRSPGNMGTSRNSDKL